MNVPNISARLLAAAKLVREGSFVADIGTDHAYLPIYLCSKGKIRGAVASDINQGPLERAEINVKEYDLEDKIALHLSNGLDKINVYAPDDIVICGMGGELIAEIIDKAKWTKNENIRLILQPMTHAEKLRGFLLSNGYAIVDETIVREDKIYQVICAEYRGASDSYSELELIFGKHNIERYTEEFKEYAKYVRSVFATRYNGKMSAGIDAQYEAKLMSAIDSLLDRG